MRHLKTAQTICKAIQHEDYHVKVVVSRSHWSVRKSKETNVVQLNIEVLANGSDEDIILDVDTYIHDFILDDYLTLTFQDALSTPHATIGIDDWGNTLGTLIVSVWLDDYKLVIGDYHEC